MTKEEIQKKIEELKAEKKREDQLAKMKDTFQHSFKIYLNSVYGFVGTKFSPVFSKDMAEAVTLSGQKIIKEMVRFTNKCLDKIGGTHDESWVIAGDTDSVLGDTRISLNRRNVEISEAFDMIKNEGEVQELRNGTEVAIPRTDTFMTDSLNGKSLIRNISRHKVKKQLYSIKAGNKNIVVTEDHSIMVFRKGKIVECKPNEIRKTDKLIIKNNK